MSITCTTSINLLDTTFSSGNCGDIGIDVNSKLTTPLEEVNTVEEFQNILNGEYIDVKNRQSITAYPTLRLLYERYLNGNNCATHSNGYNYETMQNLSQTVGNYWVDLVEQFIPSTTIWGSSLVYRNTIFDTQKYAYKRNSLFLCVDPSNSFPFSAISQNCDTNVITTELRDTEPPTESTPFDSSNFFNCETQTSCDCVYTMTSYCSPEFIGRIIGESEFAEYCEDTLLIEEVDLLLRVSIAPDCNLLNQTWNPTTRVFSQIVKVSNSSLVPTTEEYNYSVISYGLNSNNITFTVTKLNTNTLQIDWTIPLSAPEPTEIQCGYYTNLTTTFPPLQLTNIYDVIPLIVVTEPNFNCEVGRLFITYNQNP
jgi:hypothetical protein